MAMLATALALLSALGPSAKWDLRGTSIVLVEGIRGGIIGPSRHRILSFGYDWNRSAFRAVEQKWEPMLGSRELVFRARDLERDEFQRLVDGLLGLGLPDLPLEEPAECEDLYGRNTGIHSSHAARVWENQAPGGCTSSASSTHATPQQVATFDAAVVLLNRALGGGPLQAASPLDELPHRDWHESEVHMLARAVDLLRERGLASQVNANEARLTGGEPLGVHMRIPCRSAQPFHGDFGTSVVPAGSWDLRFSFEGDRILELSETPMRGEGPADVVRRAAFVEAHPELLEPQRDLILAGWVAGGMTEAMVRAAWGEPVERMAHASTVELYYMRNGNDPRESQVKLHFAADRLQLYW